jgi:hypothetical protein
LETVANGEGMMDVVAKIKNISADFTGDFAFLNDWEFWVDGMPLASLGLVADGQKTPLLSWSSSL